MLDPFIICYSLDFSIHRQLAPYAFLVANRFFSYPIVKHVLIALGGFPAKWHKKYPSGLAHTQTLLKKGSTVAIFPEGRISAHDRQFRPKKGVEVLANSQNTLLIPARIKWNRRKGFIKSYSIAVGNPFDGKNMTADQIMDVVYSLKFR
jgi:1-acyl-sn-glycerol-3-phosphate acyltransferase